MRQIGSRGETILSQRFSRTVGNDTDSNIMLNTYCEITKHR